MQKDPLRDALQDADNRRARAEISSLKQLADRWRKAAEEADARLDAALAIKTRRNVSAVVPAKKTASESTAFGIFSDWHSEETVKGSTVNGVNEFNLEIARARIEAGFRNLLSLINIQRHGTDIDTLVVGLLGDLITGYIHEELVEGNSLSPIETVLWVKDRVASGLKYLEKEGGFKRVLIPCTIGNHGRTTMKPRVATAQANSFEWLLYRVLAQEFDRAPFEWYVATGYHERLTVYDFKIRCHHGDAIKYQGGIGGITIPVNKAISQWDKLWRADLDVFGHWHQFKADTKWVANGSVIGFNAYAIKIKADYEPPSQTFFLVSPKRGRTVTAPIFLS